MTVVAQPPYEIGETATKILISRIKNSEVAPQDFKEVIFPVEMIVRESSGRRIFHPTK
jgi:DNA-binding LacI/PurR family transcriptional regulator